MLRATLIHNDKAGDACHRRADILDMLTRAGYAVACFRAKRDEIEIALDQPADVIVVAGGDGTVAKVAAKARPDGCPIAVLPFGTANNIAKSLGIWPHQLEEFVESWRRCEIRPFYPIGAVGPWGRRRIIEGLGFGAVEEAIADLPKRTGLDKARRHYAGSMLSAAPEILELRINGERIVGGFPAFEITTIPLVGPNLLIAAAADPSDRKFEICFIGDSNDQRATLARWLEAPDGCGAPMSVRMAEHAQVVGRFRRIRLDGDVWSAKADPEDNMQPIILATEPEPLPFLVPPR
jgi:diacylglycerol kinase (ATP)